MNEQRAISEDAVVDVPVSLLTFTLGEHRYALLAEHVREVVRAASIARLPKAPSIVEGVINVRGMLVPVLDVRQRFGLPARPLDPSQHFIVARAGGRTVALRVDRAHDLVSVEANVVEAAEPVVPGAEHVAGIARLAEGLLVIHDLEGFLALDEAARLEAALVDRKGAS